MYKVTGRVPTNKIRDVLVEYGFITKNWADWDVEVKDRPFTVDLELPSLRAAEYHRNNLIAFGVVDFVIQKRDDSWKVVG